MKKVTKILEVLIVILGYGVILSPILFFCFYFFDPMDGCMDVGYCKEGLPLNIEGKKITVNKQTCLENDGKWLEDRKACKFNWN